MKKIVFSMVVIAVVFLAIFRDAEAAELRGGIVDSNDQTLMAVQDLGRGNHLLMKLVGERTAPAGQGRLIKVYPSGYSVVLRSTYRDRRGVQIALPRNGSDKLVYVDYSNYIRGVAGATDYEMNRLMSLYSTSFGQAREIYEQFSTEANAASFFSAVRDAAESLEGATRMRTADKEAVMVATVRMLAGETASEITEDLIIAADVNEFAPIFDLNDALGEELNEREAVSNIMQGVDIVAIGGGGGNGGGGNGDFNGSDVAIGGGGGNGGGGNGDFNANEVAVQGWDCSESIDVPQPTNIDANVTGHVMILM